MYEDLKKDIQGKFPAKFEVIRERRIKVSIDKNSVLPFLSYIKSKGFIHLISISCVDWIKENEFEIVYHLWSYTDEIHIMLKTRISRKKPIFETASEIYPVAQTFEREIHEMFGVDFKGNKRQIPFILEDWDDIPPMRKDFDPLKYAKSHFETEEYTEEVWTKVRKIQKFRGEE